MTLLMGRAAVRYYSFNRSATNRAMSIASHAGINHASGKKGLAKYRGGTYM